MKRSTAEYVADTLPLQPPALLPLAIRAIAQVRRHEARAQSTAKDLHRLDDAYRHYAGDLPQNSFPTFLEALLVERLEETVSPDSPR